MTDSNTGPAGPLPFLRARLATALAGRAAFPCLTRRDCPVLSRAMESIDFAAHAKLDAEATQGVSRAVVLHTKDIDEMVARLRDGWLDGPESVPDRCRFVLIQEDGGELLTLCVTGNGPKGRENALAIANAWNMRAAYRAVVAAAADIDFHGGWTASNSADHAAVPILAKRLKRLRAALAAFCNVGSQP